jgi:hypothetical protein
MVAKLVSQLVLLGAVALIPGQAITRVKLDSTAPEYRPTAGSEMTEPVSMEDYYFQVNQETGRARVVVEYMYPDQPAFGLNGGRGPLPSLKQIPGLMYDAESKEVVYDANGKRTVCAKLQPKRLLFWKSFYAVPTGSCTVTSSVVEQRKDNGWVISRFRRLDTYLEVRQGTPAAREK